MTSDRVDTATDWAEARNDERARVRRALDEHFARATGHPGSGLADYVQRLRRGGVNPAHRVVLSPAGEYRGCACGDITCGHDIMLAWCDELIASYEAKVQDFAAETVKLTAALSEIEQLRAALDAARAELETAHVWEKRWREQAEAERDTARAEVKRLTVEKERLNVAVDEEINNRDAREAWADRLAYAIAPQSVIGEHSSANDPWANAVEVASALHADMSAIRAENVVLRAQLDDMLRTAAVRLSGEAGTPHADREQQR